jgi:beta-xylosidase
MSAVNLQKLKDLDKNHLENPLNQLCVVVLLWASTRFFLRLTDVKQMSYKWRDISPLFETFFAFW